MRHGILFLISVALSCAGYAQEGISVAPDSLKLPVSGIPATGVGQTALSPITGVANPNPVPFGRPALSYMKPIVTADLSPERDIVPLTFFTPLGYNSDNGIEAVNIAGAGRSFVLGEGITMNVAAWASSAYFGHYYPDRITNGSMRVALNMNVTDRLTIIGMGQYSVSEGMDPTYMPMAGPANYYGGAIRYRIAGRFGIECGVTRNYFRGKWSNSYYAVPYIY